MPPHTVIVGTGPSVTLRAGGGGVWVRFCNLNKQIGYLRQPNPAPHGGHVRNEKGRSMNGLFVDPTLGSVVF